MRKLFILSQLNSLPPTTVANVRVYRKMFQYSENIFEKQPQLCRSAGKPGNKIKGVILSESKYASASFSQNKTYQ